MKITRFASEHSSTNDTPRGRADSALEVDSLRLKVERIIEDVGGWRELKALVPALQSTVAKLEVRQQQEALLARSERGSMKEAVEACKEAVVAMETKLESMISRSEQQLTNLQQDLVALQAAWASGIPLPSTPPPTVDARGPSTSCDVVIFHLPEAGMLEDIDIRDRSSEDGVKLPFLTWWMDDEEWRCAVLKQYVLGALQKQFGPDGGKWEALVKDCEVVAWMDPSRVVSREDPPWVKVVCRDVESKIKLLRLGRKLRGP